MNNDLEHFWRNFGVDMGQSAGRDSMPSGIMVEDVGDNTTDSFAEGEIEAVNNSLEQELQSMVDRFVSIIEKENWEDSGYYVSDVYACESVERANDVGRKLAERARTFRRGFIGISIHGNHVHSIHSCAYANKSCRCSFKRFPEAQEDIRRLLRKPRAIETFKRRDWENITKYFCTKGRRTTFFKINGTIQRLPIEITNLSNIILSSENEGRPQSGLENCNDPLEYDPERKRGIAPKNDGPSGSRKRRNIVVAGGENGIGGIPGVILDLISKCAICPLSEIVYTNEYLTEAQVAIKRLDDRDVKNAIDARCSIINTWQRQDFIDFYAKEDTIKIWSSRSKDLFENYYYNYDESKLIIDHFLDFQLGNLKVQFINDLLNVIEMRIPKCNCFVVISPPSSGKNFFFDGVKDYYLNAGQMCNPNKYNCFAYQDCHNRRIIMWNEPSYESKETENLKLLFGGDNLSANVKCKPQANVKRTPVIVLSNHVPRFCINDAFQDRIKVYRFKQAPYLKEYCKKPRPDAIMDLLYSFENKQ